MEDDVPPAGRREQARPGREARLLTALLDLHPDGRLIGPLLAPEEAVQDRIDVDLQVESLLLQRAAETGDPCSVLAHVLGVDHRGEAVFDVDRHTRLGGLWRPLLKELFLARIEAVEVQITVLIVEGPAILFRVADVASGVLEFRRAIAVLHPMARLRDRAAD